MNTTHRVRTLAGILLVMLLSVPQILAEPPRMNRDADLDILPEGEYSAKYNHQIEDRSDTEVFAPRKWGITLVGRWDMQTGSGASSDFADYDDLWGDGVGASLEIFRDLLSSSTIRFGPYVSAGVDSFRGDEYRGTDSTVQTVDVSVEDMVVWTGILGFQIESQRNSNDIEFFWAGHVGGGLAQYNDVNADLRFVTLGNQVFNDEPFYESSTTWAFEATARVGFGTRSWSAFVGTGVRMFGAPDSDNRLDAGAGTLMVVPIEFSLELRF